MTQTRTLFDIPPAFPDHTQLPESDGTFVKNFQEHPQCILLTDSLTQVLEKLHPDGNYAIGQDCGIYWRETDPPEKGAEAPDWFYVPNVPPLLNGQIRRSYVLWREFTPPLIAIELASGDGSEERDTTPLVYAPEKEKRRPGKFWVYEKIIRMPFYAIYEIKTGNLEVYHLTDFTYHKIEKNARGHFPIHLLGVELGLWQGTYLQQEQLWLRWWDEQGNLLLIGQERAEIEKQRAKLAEERAEIEKQRAEQAEEKAAKLAEKLRSLGINPEDE